MLYQENGETLIAAVPAKVVDTTGAGDAFAAGLIHGLVSGMAVEQAMKEAAQWAAFAVASETSIPGDALRQYLQAQQN